MEVEDYHMCTQISEDININQNNSGQKAVFSRDDLWPQNSVIKIGFIGTGDGIRKKNFYLSGKDPLQYIIQSDPKLSTIEIIKMVINERIKPLVNLKFKFVNYSDADIRISFEKKGTYSKVGKSALSWPKSKATMNFEWLSVSTILHEFGHAIGMEHEHQSPFSTIKWNEPKVYEYFSKKYGWDEMDVDLNILFQSDEKNTNSSIFDPLSIMLYYYPAELTLDNVGTDETWILSGYDVKWITETYPKDESDDDYISAEDFYLKTYKKTLAASMAESDMLAGRITDSSFAWWKTLLIVISIIIIIIIIAVAIKTFYKNKTQSYQRIRNNYPLTRAGGVMGLKRN